jgi:hypothetical protein
MKMLDLVVGAARLIPRVVFWKNYGWRGEVIISDDSLGDIILCEFVETREEASRMVSRALLKAAAKYAD